MKKRTKYIQHDWEKMAKRFYDKDDSDFNKWLDENDVKYHNPNLSPIQQKGLDYPEHEKLPTIGEAYQKFLLQQKPKI